MIICFAAESPAVREQLKAAPLLVDYRLDAHVLVGDLGGDIPDRPTFSASGHATQGSLAMGGWLAAKRSESATGVD